ncbi:MAG: YggT family protein [Deltaproteobacteria bacterium]|jgi:YggT family protein|nr:YggT family protein [Deltaproteobacteria bacterium]
MILLSNVLSAFVFILSSVIKIYTWIIIIAALISWVRPDPYNPVVRVLRALTEPVQYRVRRRLPFVYAGGIDFSPLVIILLLQFIDIALVGSLAEFAADLHGNLRR